MSSMPAPSSFARIAATCPSIMCLRESRLRKEVERRVVVHGLSLQQTAVSVRGVLTETDVADEAHIGEVYLADAQRLLDDAVFVVGLAAAFVLMLGDAEEEHGVHARAPHLFEDARKGVGAAAPLSRHRGDLFDDVLSLADEYRIDEHGGGEPRLRRHVADDFVSSQSSRTYDHFLSSSKVSIRLPSVAL